MKWGQTMRSRSPTGREAYDNQYRGRDTAIPVLLRTSVTNTKIQYWMQRPRLKAVAEVLFWDAIANHNTNTINDLRHCDYPSLAWPRFSCDRDFVFGHYWQGIRTTHKRRKFLIFHNLRAVGTRNSSLIPLLQTSDLIRCQILHLWARCTRMETRAMFRRRPDLSWPLMILLLGLFALSLRVPRQWERIARNTRLVLSPHAAIEAAVKPLIPPTFRAWNRHRQSATSLRRTTGPGLPQTICRRRLQQSHRAAKGFLLESRCPFNRVAKGS